MQRNDTVWLACDHGGYEAKLGVIAYLEKRNIPYRDAGCHSAQSCRYPVTARAVAEAVSSGGAMRGILICSTGIGMSIFANKYKGVRAALCTDSHMAKMTRLHNDSNILCLGGKITGINALIDIVETWLGTAYDGLHDEPLEMLADADAALHSGKAWAPERDG